MHVNFVLSQCNQRLYLRKLLGSQGLSTTQMMIRNISGLQQAVGQVTLVRWLAYADDICIHADSKAELSAVLSIFNNVLTKYGMTLSAEKSFWVFYR